MEPTEEWSSSTSTASVVAAGDAHNPLHISLDHGSSSSNEEDKDEEYWYVCVICNQAFEHELQLRKHRKKVHVKTSTKVGGGFKGGFGLILSKDDLLPSVQVQRCKKSDGGGTVVSPNSSSAKCSSTDDQRCHDRAPKQATDYKKKRLSQCLPKKSNNVSSSLKWKDRTWILKEKSMQPRVNLIRVTGNAFNCVVEAGSTKSTISNTSNCREKSAFTTQHKESGLQYFSSIKVNQNFSLIKLEGTSSSSSAMPAGRAERIRTCSALREEDDIADETNLTVAAHPQGTIEIREELNATKLPNNSEDIENQPRPTRVRDGRPLTEIQPGDEYVYKVSDKDNHTKLASEEATMKSSKCQDSEDNAPVSKLKLALMKRRNQNSALPGYQLLQDSNANGAPEVSNKAENANPDSLLHRSGNNCNQHEQRFIFILQNKGPPGLKTYPGKRISSMTKNGTHNIFVPNHDNENDNGSETVDLQVEQIFILQNKGPPGLKTYPGKRISSMTKNGTHNIFVPTHDNENDNGSEAADLQVEQGNQAMSPNDNDNEDEKPVVLEYPTKDEDRQSEEMAAEHNESESRVGASKRQAQALISTNSLQTVSDKKEEVSVEQEEEKDVEMLSQGATLIKQRQPFERRNVDSLSESDKKTL